MRLDTSQLSTPVMREQTAPVMNRAKCLCVDAIQSSPSLAPHTDQVYVAQDLQMLRDRRLLELERFGDLGHGSLVIRDELEDVPPAGLSDGVEGIGSRRGAGHDDTYIFRYGNVSSQRFSSAPRSLSAIDPIDGSAAASACAASSCGSTSAAREDPSSTSLMPMRF